MRRKDAVGGSNGIRKSKHRLRACASGPLALKWKVMLGMFANLITTMFPSNERSKAIDLLCGSTGGQCQQDIFLLEHAAFEKNYINDFVG
jgi:hypothetical protein